MFAHSWAAHDAQQPWGADPAGVEEVIAELRAIPGARVEHLEADLSVPEASAEVMRAAVDAFGHVDILVANHARSSSQALEDLTAEELDRSFGVNARATFLLVREFAAQHDGRPGGRVVMMTSGQHRGPMPEELPYIASKGAIHQVTASLAAHLAPRSITLNTVNPGPTDTGWADEERRREILERMPQGRWGEPDDAARLIAWLVSDEARWVTGEVINSTGGMA